MKDLYINNKMSIKSPKTLSYTRAKNSLLANKIIYTHQHRTPLIISMINHFCHAIFHFRTHNKISKNHLSPQILSLFIYELTRLHLYLIILSYLILPIFSKTLLLNYRESQFLD